METGKITYSALLFLVVLIFSCHRDAVKQNYMTTIHPFEQIIQSELGSKGTVLKLMPPGASPHTFSLKPSDMQRTENARALFVGHPYLDNWAYAIPNVETIELLSFIPDEFKRSFDHENGDIDPHFWTDPLTVRAMLPGLTAVLIRFQPGDSLSLISNMTDFMRRLSDLDQEIKQKLAPIAGSAVVLSHPSFRYYLLRYNFQIIDIIEPHPGSDPSPRAIQEKINLYKKRNVRMILTQVAHSDQTARLISESTGIPLCKIDPLGGIPGRMTYREIIMSGTEQILETLSE